MKPGRSVKVAAINVVPSRRRGGKWRLPQSKIYDSLSSLCVCERVSVCVCVRCQFTTQSNANAFLSIFSWAAQRAPVAAAAAATAAAAAADLFLLSARENCYKLRENALRKYKRL